MSAAAENAPPESGAGGDCPDVATYDEPIEEGLLDMFQVNPEDIKILKDCIKSSPDYVKFVNMLKKEGRIEDGDDALGYVVRLVSSDNVIANNGDGTTLSEVDHDYINKLKQWFIQVIMIAAPTDRNYYKTTTYKSVFEKEMVTKQLKIDEIKQRKSESDKFLASYENKAKEMEYTYKPVYTYAGAKDVLKKFFETCATDPVKKLPRVIFNGHGSENNDGSLVFGKKPDYEYINTTSLAEETIDIFRTACKGIFHRNALRITFAQCYSYLLAGDKATGPNKVPIDGVDCVYLTSCLTKDTKVSHSSMQNYKGETSTHTEANENPDFIYGRHKEADGMKAQDHVDADNVPDVPNLSEGSR